MALFVRQDENRSELQQRLATELQDRARKKAEEADLPDGVTDSQYIRDTKQTTGLFGVWLVIAAVAIGIVIFLIITSTS